MSDDTKLILDEITRLQSEFTVLQSRFTVLQNELTGLQQGVKEIQLTLENETNRKIQLIAEEHLDFSRKLDDALKVENEKEILLIRVTSLENEVRRLKARIEKMAG